MLGPVQGQGLCFHLSCCTCATHPDAHKPSLPSQVPGLGPRGAVPHRARRQAHVSFDVRLCLWLHRELSLQDLLHRHVLVGTACRLHLILVAVLAPLPLLLDGWKGTKKGQDQFKAPGNGATGSHRHPPDLPTGAVSGSQAWIVRRGVSREREAPAQTWKFPIVWRERSWKQKG